MDPNSLLFGEVAEPLEMEEEENITLCFRRSDERKGCLKNHIVVPSKLLRKSDFFKALLAEDERPEEIEVNISCDVSLYVKCIKFLHFPGSLCLKNVDEALDILGVASEWMIDDCIQHCVNYVSAVRWSNDDESKIRDAVNRFQVEPSQDLALRLGDAFCQTECAHLKTLEKTLKDLSCLSLRVKDPKENNLSNLFENFVTKCFREDPDSDISRACFNAVVNSFKFNMECIIQGSQVNEAWVAMKFLFGLSKECDPDLAKCLIEIFVLEEKSLMHPSNSSNNGVLSMRYFMEFHEAVLECLSLGNPVTDRLVRFLFLKKRISPMAQLIRIFYEEDLDAMESKMLDLTNLFIRAAETLPFDDHIVIFNILKNAAATHNFLSHNKCTFAMFEWWIEELKNSHHSNEPSTSPLVLISSGFSSSPSDPVS